MATIVRLPDLPVVPAVDGDTVAAYRNGKVVRIPAGGGGGDIPDLATVATTGQYSDLLGRPTLGSAASMSASAFATAAQGAMADTSLQPADIGATIQAYSAILSGTTASFTAALKTKLDGIQAGAQVNTVTSVAGKAGAVTLTKGDVGLGSVDNTSDADKPISTAVSVALSDKVDNSDARLTNAREWTASTVSQAEAEAGTATTRRAWTAQRVRQAITAWWSASAAKDKLDNIQAGATANQTDAYLLNRANHTGTQPSSTITGLATVATTGSYNDLTGKPSIPAGTVTSVGLSAPTGFSVSGSPVTGSGTLALTFASGYSIPTTAKQGQWDQAYGWGDHASAGYALSSSLATVATTGSYNDLSNKPALGTAAAANIGDFATAAQGAKADTALQPAAIGVTVQGYSAVLSGTTASFTTALKSKLDGIAAGATANTGTVTSVQVTVPTGLQASGGPVTSSGTITISYASGYAIPATAKQGQWDTAYGWGDHALAGYVTTAAMHAYTYDKATIDSKIDAGGITAAEIKTLYESNSNTNAFTDAEQAKLAAAGTNANGNKFISTAQPTGGADGDVWYQVDS